MLKAGNFCVEAFVKSGVAGYPAPVGVNQGWSGGVYYLFGVRVAVAIFPGHSP